MERSETEMMDPKYIRDRIVGVVQEYFEERDDTTFVSYSLLQVITIFDCITLEDRLLWLLHGFKERMRLILEKSRDKLG